MTTYTAQWRIQVDWNRDGDFSDTNEDITEYVKEFNFTNGFTTPYKSFADDGELVVTLDNSSRLFSPDYSAGALYSADWRLRPIRVQAINSGTTTMWTGWTDTIQPASGRNGQQTATLTARGARQFLDSAKVYIPLQINKRSDQVIQTVLDKVLIPEALPAGPWAVGVSGYSEVGQTTTVAQNGISYSLDTGRETFSYAGDNWSEGITVTNAVTNTIDAERGKGHFSRTGAFTFWNRHRMLTDYTVDATYTDTDFINCEYVFGDMVQNVVTVRFNPRTIGDGLEILWQLDEPVSMNKGTEKKIRARFTEQGSDSSISGTDIVVPTELNGDLVFSSGTAQLITYEADSRGFTMVFRADVDCVISTLIVRGRKLTSYNTVEVESRDGESVFKYGLRETTINAPLIDEENVAQAIADYEVSRRKDERGEVRSITFVNKSTSILSAMLTRAIGDRIRLTENQLGHTGDYFIIGETHTVSNGQKQHEARFFLESASSNQYWLVGVTGFSEVGTNTKAGPS